MEPEGVGCWRLVVREDDEWSVASWPSLGGKLILVDDDDDICRELKKLGRLGNILGVGGETKVVWEVGNGSKEIGGW